jgi:hypothetical protein
VQRRRPFARRSAASGLLFLAFLGGGTLSSSFAAPPGHEARSPEGERTHDDSAVALVVRTLECGATARPFVCSGVLVAPRLVLTAAHCLRRQPPSSLAAVFGPDLSGPLVPVATGRIHPDYAADMHEYDLALLVLEAPAPPGFAPAPLPPGLHPRRPVDIPAGETGPGSSPGDIRWVGYGAPSAQSGDVGSRRAVRAPVLTIDKHELRYGPGSAMSCRGDSGGPVYAVGPAGETGALIGITTWGDPACKRFGVALRLDRHASFLRPLLGLGAPSMEGRGRGGQSERAQRARRGRRPFNPAQGITARACRSDADCPEHTACFGWPGQPRWCTYGGLSPGHFTRACAPDRPCGGEALCVTLPAGDCRCFVPEAPLAPLGN